MKTFISKSLFLLFIVTMSSFVFFSCKDDDDGTPPDDGKIDPSTIATDNLVAYWGFEGKAQDEIGQRGTANAAVTYVAGRRGKAYQGAEGAYITFDLANTDKLLTMKGYTASAWINAPKIIDRRIGILLQLTGKEFLGSWAFFQENVADENGGNTADILSFKGWFAKAGVEWVGQDWKLDDPSFPPNKWFHIVQTYDPVSSKATVYVNGNLLKVTTSAYGLETRYQSDPGDANNTNGALPFGNLNPPILDSGNKGIIGFWANKAFGTATDEWMAYYYGMLDELRVYNRALTADEVKQLYDAEISQIE